MVKMWTTVLWTLFCIIHSVLTDDGLEKLLEERNNLIQKELEMTVGSDIVLNDNEEKANNIIMKLKEKEIDCGFVNPQYYNFSKHFFDYKEEVKNSELFKIIQKMPKGAALHAHGTGILSPDYVLSLTYLEDLFVCFEGENIQFLFSMETPSSPCKTEWQLMRDARYSSGNVEKFDAGLKKYFTIVIDNPHEVYTDVNAVWSEFQRYFIGTTGLFTYKPVWEKYFYDSLLAFREDNVMYVEIRSVLPELYDLYGTKYDILDTAASYKMTHDQFMNDYPDFFGAKIIYAPLRSVDAKTVKEYIANAKILKKEFPDLIAGFDLVGQEDLGMPTKEFFKILYEAGDELNYFFHSGETNWFGTTSDENLADVIVLNTRRIGHGYAIIKHPLLMEEVKKRNIALEVNVISNAVLELVSDIRNHPLASFLAFNLPVVLSSDDPGVWESEPLTHDFYVTFVGVASRRADLRLLKKLALNSLYYNEYSNKDKIVHEFEIRWTKFIEEIIQG
ncbi:adenosine deaminase 2-like [Maniola hyperantus]|uniref:adenosine deaminase 2-like n=1 Tax=Aphantopus hyperantus TaxID=2795564 RepID=UPI001569E6B1|nr:adenosine deaminase 2-like [Maniola hyperantus]